MLVGSAGTAVDRSVQQLPHKFPPGQPLYLIKSDLCEAWSDNDSVITTAVSTLSYLRQLSEAVITLSPQWITLN